MKPADRKRVIKGADRPRKGLKEGQVPCPMCGKGLKPNVSTGKLNAHNAPSGDRCYGANYVDRS